MSTMDLTVIFLALAAFSISRPIFPYPIIEMFMLKRKIYIVYKHNVIVITICNFRSMVTVSHIVKKVVSEQPFVEEALGRGIISVANLAEYILPKIEKELGKKANHAAVVMALRRYSDEIGEHRKGMKKFDFTGELLM